MRGNSVVTLVIPEMSRRKPLRAFTGIASIVAIVPCNTAQKRARWLAGSVHGQTDDVASGDYRPLIALPIYFKYAWLLAYL